MSKLRDYKNGVKLIKGGGPSLGSVGTNKLEGGLKKGTPGVSGTLTNK